MNVRKGCVIELLGKERHCGDNKSHKDLSSPHLTAKPHLELHVAYPLISLN